MVYREIRVSYRKVSSAHNQGETLAIAHPGIGQRMRPLHQVSNREFQMM